MPPPPTALCAILGLDSAFARRIREAAAPSGIRAEIVAGVADARVARADVVVAACPPHGGAELATAGARTLIVCVPHGDADEPARALAGGAADVITPRTPVAVVAARLEAVARRAAADRRFELRRRLAASADVELVGKSGAFQRMRRIAESVAGTQVPVRIEGERGTGKTVVARRLHALSGRRDAGIFEVDVARMGPEAARAALFGDDRSGGALWVGRGATVLVRAVERLDPETQESLAKWLRTGALPSGPQARESTDARLVVTTRESLDGLVAGGRFRSDLAAALASVVVRVPPLRERPGDAVLLVAHFVQSAGQDPPALSERAGALLDGHPWPGNVAEAAALAVLIAARGPFASLHETELLPLLAFPSPAASGPSDLTDVQTLREATLGHVVRVLALSGGVRSRAAKALGISPRTLYNHLRGRAETAQPRKR